MAKGQPFMGREPQKAPDPNVVSTRVKHRVNRKKGTLDPLSRDEKMLCALRKALASKSGLPESAESRYHIDGDKLYVSRRGGGVQTKPGEPTTYTATGRFRMGMIHGDRASFRVAKFNITYRDVRDDRGLPDVDFIEPTTIDFLPKGTPVVPS